MTKIMVWNIQSFGANKFVDPTAAMSLAGQHVVDAVKEVNPDILVVIEVRSGFVARGRLITSTGGQKGVIRLREKLGADWHVVPPLILNGYGLYRFVQNQKQVYSEGIAVFFRSSKLDFVGPCVWNGTTGVTRSDAAKKAAKRYADTTIDSEKVWAAVLPNGAPGGCAFQGLTQDQFAGQVIFAAEGSDKSYLRDARPDDELEFPARWGRNPFYTAFWDRNGERVIKLLSVHLPPHYGGWGSQRAMRAIGRIKEFGAPIETDSARDTKGVQVILGDFNINSTNPKEQGSYTEPPFDGYQAFVPTTKTATLLAGDITPRTKAPFLSVPKNWRGFSKYGNYLLALDNILVKYYGDAPGTASGFAVKDWVPAARPPGTLHPNAYLAQPLPIKTTRGSFAKDTAFVEEQNFGKMRHASDHLALVIEV